MLVFSVTRGVFIGLRMNGLRRRFVAAATSHCDDLAVGL